MDEVQHVTSDHLPDDIYQQIASFIRLVWLTYLKGDDRFWVLRDPTGHIDHFYVAERGVLVSHACVNQRVITHLGETYTLRGLGAVFTYPAFRKEGHGARVVAAASEFVRSTDADVAMLFTDPNLEPFYAAHGWTALRPDPGITSGNPEHPDFDDAFVMMQFLSEKSQAHRDDFLRGPIFVGDYTW